MFIAVEHKISDPKSFWTKAASLTTSLPSHVTLHQTFPARDGKRAICIWEAAAIQDVKNVLEPEVGKISQNEYYEVENKEAVALPKAFQAVA